VGQRLAAEQRDPFDALAGSDLNLTDHVGQAQRAASLEWEHLGIAAPRAAERTPLEPEGEAPPGSLGFGAGDDLGDTEGQVGVHYAATLRGGHWIISVQRRFPKGL
jgi:hypothetical protein